MDEYYRILESLPPALRTPLAKLDAHYAPHIQEIRLRLGQPVQFTICGRLCPAAKFLPGSGLPAALETDTLRDCFLQLCRRSVYAYGVFHRAGRLPHRGSGLPRAGRLFRRNVAQSAHCALADLSAAARAGGTDRCPHRRAAAGRPAGQRQDHPAALSCAKALRGGCTCQRH